MVTRTGWVCTSTWSNCCNTGSPYRVSFQHTVFVPFVFFHYKFCTNPFIFRTQNKDQLIYCLFIQAASFACAICKRSSTVSHKVALLISLDRQRFKCTILHCSTLQYCKDIPCIISWVKRGYRKECEHARTFQLPSQFTQNHSFVKHSRIWKYEKGEVGTWKTRQASCQNLTTQKEVIPTYTHTCTKEIKYM